MSVQSAPVSPIRDPVVMPAPAGDPPPPVVRRVVDRFTPVLEADREAARLAAPGAAAHRALVRRVACLWEIERAGDDRGRAHPEGALRILAWNVERLKYAAPTASLLRWARPDVTLLSEVDIGMARSGNRHTVQDLAVATDQAGFTGIEFVENGIGDARERAWHAGAQNLDGLHGNAILSPHLLAAPRLVRFDDHGSWFDADPAQRRIGGRMALLATIRLRGRAVVVGSLHLESDSDPDERGRQMAHLLAAVEDYAPGAPAVIGGDVNSHLFGLGARHDADAKRRLVGLHGDLVHPERVEPLFAAAREAGWSFAEANVIGAATMRTRPDGTPVPPHGKLDWIFTRGLVASDPVVIPAIDHRGRAISDHEAVAVTVDLPRDPS